MPSNYVRIDHQYEQTPCHLVMNRSLKNVIYYLYYETRVHPAEIEMHVGESAHLAANH